MIEIEGLTKKFGTKVAVADLTLTVPAGHIFAFLGPNGAGKTTTIKLIVGLLRPDAGRVRICGHDVEAESLVAKAQVSYVPDQPYLYDKLTGREFLAFVAEMYHIERGVFELKVADLSDMFELEDYLDDLCESYSHGMKQRVVLSAALLHDPRVIVVDEPMVGLDPKSARMTKDLFRRKAEAGVTVFMSTHTLSVAEDVAQEIGIINRGRLVTHGSLEELRRESSTAGDLEDLFLRLTAETEDG